MDTQELLRIVQQAKDEQTRECLWRTLFNGCNCRSRSGWVSFRYFPICKDEGLALICDREIEAVDFSRPVSGYEAIEALLKEGRELVRMRDGLIYIRNHPESIHHHTLVIPGAVEIGKGYMAIPIFYTSKWLKRRIAYSMFLSDIFNTSCRFLVYK